jgi:nicotinate-nucleotide pyrophosphorylase (carboxylating)
VALNFLTLLSAVATKARDYARAVRPYKTKIMDTRKTIPGLRQLEKYAVRVGGGYNHRMRLDEMVLIKDNHLVALCALRRSLCVQEIIENIRRKNPKLKVEIEVKNLKEFSAALKAKPDIIMLDNMNIPGMRMAVAMKRRTQDAGRRTLLEASGGITLKNIKQVAACGVDMISIGELTDSIRAVDLSLEFLSR